MNQQELVDQYLRIQKLSNAVVLEVLVITWNGHTPDSTWTPFRGWTQSSSESELRSARQAALSDPRYFATCSMRNEHLPAGHMHDDRICSACAQNHLGIIY